MIREVEDPLQAEKDRIDGLKKEQEEREAREKQEREMKRVNEVINAGCAFDGVYYVIGDNTSIAAADIANCSPELWETFMSKVREEKDRLDLEAEEERQRKAQEERKQQEEREKLEKEKADLEAEKEKLKESRIRARQTVLKASGYVINASATEWDKKTPAVEGTNGRSAGAFIPVSKIEEMEDAEFYDLIDKNEKGIQEANAKIAQEVEEERQRKAQEEKDRLAAEAAKKQLDDRTAQVNEAGLDQFDYKTRSWHVTNPSGSVRVSNEDLTEKTAEEWPAFMAQVEADVDHLAMTERNRQQAAAEEQQRKDDEAAEQRRKEAEEKRQKALKELPEADQVGEYLKALLNVPVPEITGVMSTYFKAFQVNFLSLTGNLNEVVKNVQNAATAGIEGGKE
jgi:hypothetical protein